MELRINAGESVISGIEINVDNGDIDMNFVENIDGEEYGFCYTLNFFDLQKFKKVAGQLKSLNECSNISAGWSDSVFADAPLSDLPF